MSLMLLGLIIYEYHNYGNFVKSITHIFMGQKHCLTVDLKLTLDYFFWAQIVKSTESLVQSTINNQPNMTIHPDLASSYQLTTNNEPGVDSPVAAGRWSMPPPSNHAVSIHLSVHRGKSRISPMPLIPDHWHQVWLQNMYQRRSYLHFNMLFSPFKIVVNLIIWNLLLKNSWFILLHLTCLYLDTDWIHWIYSE